MRSALAGAMLLLAPLFSIAQGVRPTDHVLYLIGDAGEAGEEHGAPVFRLLREVVAADAAKERTILFLGDNLYPEGLHKKGHPLRAQDEANLNAQLDAVRDLDARALFIPGNHDWKQGGKSGWKYVQREERYIRDTLGRKAFLPHGGCPGPEVVKLGNGTVLVVLDTQWWLHRYRRAEGERDGCEVATEADLLAALKNVLNEYRDQRIIVAAHHPFLSYSSHGGHFPLRTHLFPFTELNQHLWIPLPVLGSIYPAYRALLGDVQDVAHARYNSLRAGVEALLEQFPGSVYASGHEHILQYLQRNAVHHVISGAGSRTTWMKRSKQLDFGRSERGFARLVIAKDGALRLEFYTLDHGAMPEAAFNLQGVERPPITVDDRPGEPLPDTITVAPNTDLHASAFKRFFFGSLLRDVWCAPITVPVLDPDSAFGGLRAKAMGGGFQTRSLRLDAADGHAYVLRSIRKYPGLALAPNLRGTVAEDVVSDGIAASHPYAGIAIPPLADAVHVLHTNPRLVVVPDHPALGAYRGVFSNTLCLLEERTDGDWRGSAQFGGSERLASSGELIEALREGHDDVIDVPALLRARLLDMTIGDWDRHDDQWRWATFKQGDRTVYKPIPRDRDQAFFTQNGLIPSLTNRRWGISKFQAFGPDIRDINGQNFNARYLDRAYLTEPDRALWQAIADSMRTELTDAVIEEAIHRFPDTTFALVGPRLIAGLKGRRDKLPKIAERHYRALAKRVNVVGTDEDEFFEVVRLPEGRTEVNIYDRKHGKKVGKRRYFHRVFEARDTREIRLYGLEGHDEYRVKGDVRSAIKVRIIGGMEKDVIQDSSRVSGPSKRTIVYESGGLKKGNKLRLGPEARLVRSARSDALDYDRTEYVRDVLMPLVSIGLNPDDGLFLGGGFSYTKQGFKVEPYKWRQRLLASVALRTGAYRVQYSGRVNKAFAGLDAGVDARLLAPDFNFNFFGFGNRTTKPEDEEQFQYRIDLIDVEPFLARTFGGSQELRLTGLYRSASQGRLSPALADRPELRPQPDADYAGAALSYRLNNVDNEADPERGIRFHAEVDELVELHSGKEVRGVAGDLRFYIPARIVPARTVIALRVAASRRDGAIDPLVARYLGGQSDMRGLRRTRYSGNSMAVGNFEVRQDLFNSRNRLVPFRMGLLAFADAGRVWVDGRDEHFWHSSVGGGLFLSPFNMVILQASYAVSDDDAIVDVRLGFFF
ncbi:MAG: metallophosphoesterase [Flavobacteriales bacterium]|nr:metallophosphoesterase [Flavobacteriales bacterium]